MMIPTIHLNGTAAQDLISQLCDAMAAIRDAEAALVRCSPNGRDYYPQGPDAINKAVREHNARIEKLNAVGAELVAITEAVVAADDARTARKSA
jgi:hypothetical protein